VRDPIDIEAREAVEGTARDSRDWLDHAIEQLSVTILPRCDHEWAGWREFEDGRGGERVCKKCGLGAMAHSLMEGI
jgi:hypothetical protein